MDYAAFFRSATGHEPYPYQARIAERNRLPALLRIPTGAGKTEAAILGWLYRHCHHPAAAVRAATPRRLVYCLPMRTLVEQTAERARSWLDALGMTDEVDTVVLMGGEPRVRWYLHPEKSCIIIGTQDMLLSRALNRGYGSSPFMWPVEYGLLNSDCLWVIDEVQLMANGLPTSTQLAGLRRRLGSFGPGHSIWMSATVKPGWLDTVDHAPPAGAQVLELGPGDLADARLARRHHARKIVSQAPVESGRRDARAAAGFITGVHQPGTLTLAIVNTVERAQAVYKALRRISAEADTVLIHARFRGRDREEKRKLLTQKIDETSPGRIVIATQAIEAGVDISARALVTELAPWPSLVQRFGRCNRGGEHARGEIHWVDVGARRQDAAPYRPDELEPARQLMQSLEGGSAGPAEIENLGDVMQEADHPTIVRRRDVVGLFDTAPDLSGSYVDVSQYVRGMDERDVTVFWRSGIPAEGPGENEPKPVHAEAVSVPLGRSLNDYLQDGERKAWRWDFLDSRWMPVRAWEIRAGMTLMLDAAQGGYSPELGWDPAIEDAVPVEASEGLGPAEGQGSDHLSIQRRWVTLSDHTRRVVCEADEILNRLSALFRNESLPEIVRTAARYHDAGKAHPAFQAMLRDALPEDESAPDAGAQMAKSPGRGRMDPGRRHFRHELGSALAVLAHADGLGAGRARDLAAYLAAAHHGKVRLAIRSLPGPRRGLADSNPDPETLLGYSLSETETLPAVELDAGLDVNETVLDLSLARIGLSEDGARSWLERSLGLLAWLGPFRLAYLEAVLRAADMRASMREEEEVLE